MLATLELLEATPDLLPASGRGEEEIGPPFSAVDAPCQRCWVYPHQTSPWRSFCPTCSRILAKAARLGSRSRSATVLWGFVNELPKHLWNREGFYADHVLASYVQDAHHFLLMMNRQELKPWLQELALYHGSNLKGLIQVLPTSGGGKLVSMGDILCRAAYQEARFTMDQLRVRFFAAPYQLLIPHTRDQMGILTFEVADFLSLLEMASVFRTVLFPDEQQSLRQLLALEDPQEQQFYWGRFTGRLNQKAKDMLSAWGIRQWPKHRVKLLYELADYVEFYSAG
jgi:hypothetical protein